MYGIAVERFFDAAHYLREYQGKCEAMHGHRYRVVVRISAAGLNDIGLAYDFTDLKKYLDEILARFDHTCLNEVPPFDEINPSAENLAATIYQELKEKLAADPVTLEAVEAWETPHQGVIYKPG
jgi:6-pyruvoyltetrahydropterin/6-carboxytetrahydropterin synthase